MTLVYDSYRAMWDADEIVSVLLLVFPFWSCVVSYRGVLARFDVRRGRARLWFLILPMALYLIAFGVIGVLYTVMT